MTTTDYSSPTRVGPISPGVSASFRAQGVVRRSDLLRLARVSRIVGFPVVITQGSCTYLGARLHHTKHGVLDIRTIGLTDAERDALRTALQGEGFRVYYHAPGNVEGVAPHFHVSRPGTRTCDAHRRGGLGALARNLSATPRKEDRMSNSNEKGHELTWGDYAAFVGMGAAAAILGRAIVWGVNATVDVIKKKKSG